DRRRDVRAVERAQLLDQWQIRVDRGFADPVAPMRPAPVVQHVREMTVEHDDEVELAHVSSAAKAWCRKHATVELAVSLLGTLPPEVARHRLALHRLPRLRMVVVIDGPHAGLEKIGLAELI